MFISNPRDWSLMYRWSAQCSYRVDWYRKSTWVKRGAPISAGTVAKAASATWLIRAWLYNIYIHRNQHLQEIRPNILNILWIRSGASCSYNMKKHCGRSSWCWKTLHECSSVLNSTQQQWGFFSSLTFSLHTLLPVSFWIHFVQGRSL